VLLPPTCAGVDTAVRLIIGEPNEEASDFCAQPALIAEVTDEHGLASRRTAARGDSAQITDPCLPEVTLAPFALTVSLEVKGDASRVAKGILTASSE
jgi:hypothetical protein